MNPTYIKYSHLLPQHIELIDDITVRKTGLASSDNALKYYQAVVNHFINYPDPMVVPVSNFQNYGKQSNGCYQYSYDMMRMYILSEEEKNIIRDYYFDYDIQDLVIYQGVTRSRDLDIKNYSDIFSFLKKVYIDDRYNDLHNGNIMRNEIGDYRLIDLEGFSCYEFDLTDPSNAWIKVAKEQNEAA